MEINFDALKHAAEVIMAEGHGIILRRVEDSDGLSSDGEGRVISFRGEDSSYAIFFYTEKPGYPDLNGNIQYTKSGASFMVNNCGKDCHVLIKLGSNCADSNANCPNWASQGYCTKTHVAYMREKCKKSCNVC